MRRAEIGDIWKLLRKSKKRGIGAIELKWSQVPGLTDGALVLASPITLICGENGAGKSRLMHTIYRAFLAISPGAVGSRFFRRGSAAERVKLKVIENGASWSKKRLASHFFPKDEAERVHLFCPTLVVADQLDEIRDDESFEERLEGAVVRQFDATQLKYASLILARTYSSIEAIDIEATSYADEIPYFRAESHGVTYGSADMGEGELAVFNLLDLLWRLGDRTVLLIEEPESFLAPRAQVVLADVLADIAGSRGITCVLSSHSGAIAKRLTAEEVQFVSRGPNGVSLESPARKADLVEKLGLLPAKVMVFFLEDEVAIALCRALIDAESKQLFGRGEFIDSKGVGGVVSVARALPADIRSVAHIAVLDGDQRGLVADRGVIFLPSQLSPDELLRRYALGLELRELSLILGAQSAVVSRALTDSDGLDSHDWMILFAKGIGCSRSDLVRRLALAWAAENRDLVRAFVQQIEQAAAE